ncbi:metallophosphoesterase [Tissierella sp. Yu-01]|uniref:metallophosphoesterase n=1 Tax=Tissierella sp. Yu-01 TaxID=3035694 RepID=UPI00240DD6F4|nr:metallophosphoesterase [Tissierella sp. Yu-01]WFA08937.1 metallophosphoesterase [Tissierella sp. Yu-01]
MNFKRYILLLVIIGVLFAIYNYYQISKFHINKVKLNSNKLINPLRITQITDFHSNENINLKKLFSDIKGFNPDIIVITGDLIDYKTRDLTMAFKILEQAKKITDRVYFVSGNHETNHVLEDEFYNGLAQYEVTVLDDISTEVRLNENEISILGASFFAEKDDFEGIYKDISEKGYNILLSHSPNRPIMYINEKLDLILSGHTHGGQVRLPIIGGIIAPGQGFFPKYDKGLFKFGNTTLYIDSGLGNSVYPIRMFNRVQISNIEILPR